MSNKRYFTVRRALLCAPNKLFTSFVSSFVEETRLHLIVLNLVRRRARQLLEAHDKALCTVKQSLQNI